MFRCFSVSEGLRNYRMRVTAIS